MPAFLVEHAIVSRSARKFQRNPVRSRAAFSGAAREHKRVVTDEPRKSSEEPAESGSLEAYPPEGEQERSAESDETLSPDEKSA